MWQKYAPKPIFIFDPLICLIHARPERPQSGSLKRQGKTVRAQSVQFGNVTLDSPAIEPTSASFDLDPLILGTLASMQARDQTTFWHSQSVSTLMTGFARQLGMDEPTVQSLGLAGLLHDIGKTELPMDMLEKPGALTEQEMENVRSHPARGHAILSRSSRLPNVVLDICLHHHERIDGTGYPMGLTDSEIGLPVRIATICDVYDALISPRPYRKPWSHHAAATWMFETKGFFDRDLLGQFLRQVTPD